MPVFIPGKTLSRNFFFEVAKPILDQYFPKLAYTAGFLGYGSDVLGYDDEISRDHMWGPRFYLFLRPLDLCYEDEIRAVFAQELPYTYCGYSVNFSQPNPDDHGVQLAEMITEGPVNPLIWIQTVAEYLSEQLGRADVGNFTAADWLSISEHRLLSLAAGELYHDDLGMQQILNRLAHYPDVVRRYLIASCWDAIACEEAFVKRTGVYGDEIGSRLICARIAERLMRLCFLYRNTYAPYSKWFGTAFDRLDVPEKLKTTLREALRADDVLTRETFLTEAQSMVAMLHNESGLTEPLPAEIVSYFRKDILVIWAERFAEATQNTLCGTELEHIPLMGSLSQAANLSTISDDPASLGRIRALYR